MAAPGPLQCAARRRTIPPMSGISTHPGSTAEPFRDAPRAPGEPGPVAAARSLAPRISGAATATERDRRVAPELVRAIADQGLFRLLVPRSVGGLEADPATMIGAIETIARADGSAGWCLMIGATSGVLAAYLDAAGAREIYGADAGAITGGVFHPRGRAVVEDGGYRVTGRWPFASGCQHCTWLLGGCLVFAAADDPRPRSRADGRPEMRLLVFPAAEVEVIDTWNVSGLRGTGSHDIAVRSAYVPRDRSAWFGDAPVHPGRLYSFPVYGLLALGIAAVGLGIARGAIDDLVALAGGKIPTGARRPLAERSAIQTQVAQAEALVGGARALLLDTVGAAWSAVSAGEPMTLERRARLRLAATHAVREAARAVDLMYEAGGGTAIYDESSLQRRFRDVHVATQHVMVAPPTLELVGRVLLGLETDTEML